MHTDHSPIVTTDTGRVRGRGQNGTNSYLNIPYAAPPAGAGRFAEPVPHLPWTEVRDATAPGPTAPQPRRDAFGRLDMSPLIGPGWVPGDDYLTVNVWAPEGAEHAPVMVFVHGGGFVAGSARALLYDGRSFARDGVVLVTLNYRLGIAGFLDLPDAPANRGLLDVVAALRWVRRNIVSFGGDPGNVTLFGQSAGATLVGGVLATPEAAGLFRRAILQSGSGSFDPDQAARVRQAAAAALGVDATAAAFADIPDDRFVEMLPELVGLDLRTGGRFDPMLGLSTFNLVLDQQPAESVAAGLGAEVDLIVGNNTEEGNLYLVPQGELTTSTAADVTAIAARAHHDPAKLVAGYQAQRPGANDGEIRSAILTDAVFGAGSRSLAEAHAAHGKGRTFRYEFAWRSSGVDGQLGATHAMELPFVFDRIDLPQLLGPTALLGPGEPPAELANRMHSAWIGFARNGDPGWDQYDNENRRTLHLASKSTIVSNPRAAELDLWQP